MIWMNYKDKMKELRLDNDLLQKDIAEIMGISLFTYSHYENEYQIIPIKHLIVFCNYFNISIDYFFSFSNIKQYNNYKEINVKTASLRFKNWRKEQNLTQNKLAKNLNTTQAVIANYERGRTLIATPFLYTICKKYNISADYLLGRIDNPKYLK